MLNEKLSVECIRSKNIGSTASLETEVSTPLTCPPAGKILYGSDRNPSDKKSRNQSTRYFKNHPPPAEPATTSQQVAPGDPLPYRQIFPTRGRRGGHEADCSTDSCMPILAPVHYIGSNQLGGDIQPQQEPHGVKPGTSWGSPPGSHSGREKRDRALLSAHVTYPKHRHSADYEPLSLEQTLPEFLQSMPSLRSLKFGSPPKVHWDRSVDPFESLQ